MTAASITVAQHLLLERVLTIEIVRVTERAAVSAARLRGHGKSKASDQAAVDASTTEPGAAMTGTPAAEGAVTTGGATTTTP